MDPESVDVTAGLGGFVAFFVLAVALYFLMRNMNARMQRMAYRAELEELAELEAKAAEDASTGADAGSEAVDGPAAPDAALDADADAGNDEDPLNR